MSKIGVLIVNLGTPDSQKPSDVRKYLIEFLTDGRVIDKPWLLRQLLVRGIIVPKRYRESAKNYSRIWTEKGSPLKVYGESVQLLLQESLGTTFQVELAMRYKNPSIESSLNKLKLCRKLVVIPLFPQYASATTGSIHQKVMELIAKWETIPELHFINSYPVQQQMIDAFCARARECNLSSYHHYLFSFHGLPEKHILKADSQDICMKSKCCCTSLCDKNKLCYSAQCYATARAIAQGLGISSTNYSVSFQSRLGKDPWIQPYTIDTLEVLLAQKHKKILVFSPAFVADCLETIDEIGNEYRHQFIQKGGLALDLVPGLNTHPLWIQALTNLVLQNS